MPGGVPGGRVPEGGEPDGGIPGGWLPGGRVPEGGEPDGGGPGGGAPRPAPRGFPGGVPGSGRSRRPNPLWIALGIAIVGSLALVIYAFLKRDSSQIPLLATAAAIFGIVLLVLAFGGAVATYRAARDGRAGRAVVFALAGGFAMIAAAGVLAFATILGLLYHP